MGTASNPVRKTPRTSIVEIAYKEDIELRKDLDSIAQELYGQNTPVRPPEFQINDDIGKLIKIFKNRGFLDKYPLDIIQLSALFMYGYFLADSTELDTHYRLLGKSADEGFQLTRVGPITKAEYIDIWDRVIKPGFKLKKTRNRGFDSPLLSYSIAKAKVRGMSGKQISESLRNGKLEPFNKKMDLTYKQINEIHRKTVKILNLPYPT